MKRFTALLWLFSAGTLMGSLVTSFPAQAQYPSPYSTPYPVPYPTPGVSGYPAVPSAPVLPSPYPVSPGTYPFPGSYPTNPNVYPSPVRTSSATTFICGRSGNDPATLVQVNNRTLRSPLIVWKTHYFGDEYTPEQRCQSVSQRLTQVVAQNGGRLSNLRLSVGSVYGLTVVCYLNNATSCNQDNILFTLKPQNARNAPGILSRLSNFGQFGGGASVNESSGLNNDGGSISLEDEVTQAEQMEGGSLVPDSYNPGGYSPTPTNQTDPGSAGGAI